MREAMLYERREAGAVRCRLCAHGCVIVEGKRGLCGVRENRGGTLFSLVYGHPIAADPDPIEKKPLFHFLPGSRSFSIATPGCNFQCGFCQNWSLSQAPREGDADLDRGEEIPPAAIAAAARRAGCQSVSYTYTEPTVYFEYAHAIMGEAVGQGLRNVFVSNGYQSPACVEACRGLLHAANIDLKAFRDGFYRQNCQARLAPVLDTLKRLFAMGVWLEITTLLIPGQNDDPAELGELAGFIVKELAPWVPWHVSAYTPRYKYARQGPPPTPPATLERALAIGRQAGLHYVYAGNLFGHQSESTLCPACGGLLVERRGYQVRQNRLADGHCPGCGAAIPGVWA